MCGVAGAFVQPDGSRSSRTMVDGSRTAGRTPAASGAVDTSTDVQLAHRRLSIIDLSAAADQPMIKHGLPSATTASSTTSASCAPSSQAPACGSRPDSDTEVVLEAWRRWGTGALARFRGMFAFAIHDAATRLARAGPRPARHQAPLRDAARRRRRVRLRAQGARRRGRSRAASRPGGDRRLDALLLGAPGARALHGVRKLPAGSWTE